MENSNINWTDHTWNPWIGNAFGEPVLRIPVKRRRGNPGGGSKGQKDTVECFWTNFDLTASCAVMQQAA